MSVQFAGELELVGSPTPRLATARPRGRSRGTTAIRFARERLGVELLPWQEWVLRAALVQDERGRWASRTVGVLVARQNGKTRLTTIRALAGMVVFGEREVLAAAQNREVAIAAWHDALELALEAELGVTNVRRTNGQESFRIGGAHYKVIANTRAAARGLSADLVIMDELREYRDSSGWAALEKTRRARVSSQAWAISNEGDEGSEVLDRLATEGRLNAATGAATDAAWFEWSAEPELERTDPRGWVQANPALGHLISAETVASEARHDDPYVFETEVLCRRVASLRPWLPAGAWESCIEPAASVPDGASVCFALDAGPELRHATVGVAWRRPDGRAHLEAVAGFLADDGPVLPRAAQRLAELVLAWPTNAVAVVARSGAEAAAVRALEGSEVPVLPISSAELVRAANAFHEATVARQIVHPGDPMTAGHFAAVTSDGVLRRRSPAADIDAAVALVLARHAAGTAPVREPAQDWVAF